MLIKVTDFVGEVNVFSSLEEHGNGKNLQYFIDKYTEHLLLFCLGSDNLNTLKTYLDTEGQIQPTAPQVWLDFSEKAKESLKYYVFYFYKADEYSQLTISPKNADVSPLNTKLATTWNNFVKEYQGEKCNINYHGVVSYINNFEFHDYYTGNTTENSLVSFVKDTFNYTNYRLFDIINRYGL